MKEKTISDKNFGRKIPFKDAKRDIKFISLPKDWIGAIAGNPNRCGLWKGIGRILKTNPDAFGSRVLGWTFKRTVVILYRNDSYGQTRATRYILSNVIWQILVQYDKFNVVPSEPFEVVLQAPKKIKHRKTVTSGTSRAERKLKPRTEKWVHRRATFIVRQRAA
jgi:hypothetical protein